MRQAGISVCMPCLFGYRMRECVCAVMPVCLDLIRQVKGKTRVRERDRKRDGEKEQREWCTGHLFSEDVCVCGSISCFLLLSSISSTSFSLSLSLPPPPLSACACLSFRASLVSCVHSLLTNQSFGGTRGAREDAIRLQSDCVNAVHCAVAVS